MYEVISMEVQVERIKGEYLASDLGMKDLIEKKYNWIPVEYKRELIFWSGEADYVTVLDTGEMECRDGENEASPYLWEIPGICMGNLARGGR